VKCGAGVPVSRKGLFHSHSAAVARVFKGYAHLLLSAVLQILIDQTATMYKYKRVIWMISTRTLLGSESQMQAAANTRSTPKRVRAEWRHPLLSCVYSCFNVSIFSYSERNAGKQLSTYRPVSLPLRLPSSFVSNVEKIQARYRIAHC
jgi:hypothetical protein